MAFIYIIRQPIRVFYKHTVLVMMMLLVIILASIYPSDLENDYAASKGGHDMPFVVATEN